MGFDWTPFITAIQFDEDPFRELVLVAETPVRRVFMLGDGNGVLASLEVRGARDQYRTKLTLSYQTRREITDLGMAFEGGQAHWTLTGLRSGVPAAMVFRVSRCGPFPGLIVEVDDERVGEIEALGRVPWKFRPGGWENRVVVLPVPATEAPRAVRVSALNPKEGDLSVFSVAVFQPLPFAGATTFAHHAAEALRRVSLLQLDLTADASLEDVGWRFSWDAESRRGRVETSEGRDAILHIPLNVHDALDAKVSPEHGALVPWRALGEWFSHYPTRLPEDGSIELPDGTRVNAWAEGQHWHFVTLPVNPIDEITTPRPAKEAVLIIDPKAHPERVVHLDPARTYVLGRSPAVDIVVDHLSVSRSHARLARSRYGWVITDLGSRHGLHVNGKAVTQHTFGPSGSVTCGPLELLLAETIDGLDLTPRELVDVYSWLAASSFGPFSFGYRGRATPLVEVVRRFMSHPDAAEIFRYVLDHGRVGARLVALIGLRRVDPGHFERAVTEPSRWQGEVVCHGGGCDLDSPGTSKSVSHLVESIRRGDYDHQLT